jgi:hypothetical protein
MDRSEADLRCVLMALDSRLGNPATAARQEQANFTLQCFVDEHQRFPGPSELERWRTADPVRKRVLLSASAIRKAFGGDWSVVGAAWVAGTAGEDLTARRLTAMGPKFGREQLLAIGRAFVAWMPASGPLRRDDLVAFLKSQRDENTTGLPRLPRDYYAFRRVFGSFEGFLTALGQEHRSRYATARMTAPPSDPGPSRFKGMRFRGTDAERLEGVREAAKRYGALLSYPQYNAFRAEAVLAAGERGEDVPWPHSRTLVGKYGSWPAVKLAARVCTEADVASGAAQNTFSDDELVDALAQALLDYGPELTATGDYRVWRVRLQAQLASAGKPARVPRARLLSARLGGPRRQFTDAIRTVLDRRPDVAARLRDGAA